MTQASVLICTHPVDSHACAVDHVLRATGHNSYLVDTSNIVCGESLSIDYRSEPSITIGEFVGCARDLTSVWNRRITREKVFPTYSDPVDHPFLKKTANAVMSGALALLDQAFPVNPSAARTIYSNKLNQLAVAREVGFRIPDTLISNIPSDINDFFDRHADVCLKGYYSQAWMTGVGVRHGITTIVKKEDIGDRLACEIMPHIYQEYIPKVAEYRLTLFGGFARSIAIDSSRLTGAAVTDWRANVSYHSGMELKTLPDDVLNAARRLMKGLGLRFGTMDLALTPAGEYVFFEVNEQGQWLWKEMHCPECVVLQPFAAYLASGNDDFIWNDGRNSRELSVEAVFKEVEADSRYTTLLTQGLIPVDGEALDERATS